MNRYFRVLQLGSAGFMAFAHGSNDAQKSMGIITLALAAYAATEGRPGDDLTVPVVGDRCCATAMALGTASGGWRIMKTMGHRIIKLRPINGFAAETAASLRDPDRDLAEGSGQHHARHLIEHHGCRGIEARFGRPMGCGPEHARCLGTHAPDHRYHLSPGVLTVPQPSRLTPVREPPAGAAPWDKITPPKEGRLHKVQGNRSCSPAHPQAVG